MTNEAPVRTGPHSGSEGGLANLRGHSGPQRPGALVPAPPGPPPARARGPHRCGASGPGARGAEGEQQSARAPRGGAGSRGPEVSRGRGAPPPRLPPAPLGPAASLGSPQRVLTTRLSRFPMAAGCRRGKPRTAQARGDAEAGPPKALPPPLRPAQRAAPPPMSGPRTPQRPLAVRRTHRRPRPPSVPWSSGCRVKATTALRGGHALAPAPGPDSPLHLVLAFFYPLCAEIRILGGTQITATLTVLALVRLLEIK